MPFEISEELMKRLVRLEKLKGGGQFAPSHSAGDFTCDLMSLRSRDANRDGCLSASWWKMKSPSRFRRRLCD
jgi:hypothetical protein